MPTLPLPDAVQLFYALGNGEATAPLAQCLTDDAVVHDEGGTHIGHPAIAAWMQDVRHKYGFIAEPRATAWEGAALTVRTQVSGRFPGSPIELDYAFRLEQDLIAGLRIG